MDNEQKDFNLAQNNNEQKLNMEPSYQVPTYTELKSVEEAKPVVEPQEANTVNNEVPQPVLEEMPVQEPPMMESVNMQTEQSQPQPVLEQNTNINLGNDKSKGSGKSKTIIIVLVILLLVTACVIGVFLLSGRDSKNTTDKVQIKSPVKQSDYRLSGNTLENFDLYFLKLQNEKSNKIYSPLSIKYALEMLYEGADGETKSQIEAILGEYENRKYTNSKNMSFANAIFIRNSFKDSMKQDYIDLLTSKYNAEVILDSFESPDTINKWVKNKTLDLLDNLVDDVSDLDLALVNALAIDMEWEKVIQPVKIVDSWNVSYDHENYSAWVASLESSSYKVLEFDGDKSVKSTEIGASINNYDIVSTLGESNIRKTVGDAYREYINDSSNGELTAYNIDKKYSELTEDEINKEIELYLDNYIKSIDKGYGQYSSSTDFLLYVDDNVKVFAKNLKKYDGTTLQYVGIMPLKENLDSYVSNLDATKVNGIINNLKDISPKNFKEGVITKVTGYIPLFKFNYELDLKSNLQQLGITDAFDSEKANLSKISTADNLFISDAKHKANIEFSNEGIKASAATMMGGAGAASIGFNYLYDVPVEEIDLTFDKPYMFIIRDKDTGEVWFTGTVYEPIEWSQEKTQAEQETLYQEYEQNNS